jgi:phosphoglycerate dehydrogenase-like enzyme
MDAKWHTEPTGGELMSGEIVLLGSDDRRAHMMEIVFDQQVDAQWVSASEDLNTVAENCREAIVIVTTETFFDTDLARKCPNLKLLQRLGAGTDGFPVDELAKMNVSVANNGGGNSVAVAEHAIALMVGTYRKLQLQVESVVDRKWQGQVRQHWGPNTHELSGKTVGIVGAGNIGCQVAQRLQGWECVLVYHDIIEIPREKSGRLNIERLPLNELLSVSDVVTLHVPHTKSTYHMISDGELGLMKSGGILINTGRGPVIDEEALIKALQAGVIAGAGLDVLEKEPPLSNNLLLDMDNVMVTPHLAGMSLEATYKSLVFGLSNAVRVVAGYEPKSVILPD